MHHGTIDWRICHKIALMETSYLSDSAGDQAPKNHAHLFRLLHQLVQLYCLNTDP